MFRVSRIHLVALAVLAGMALPRGAAAQAPAGQNDPRTLPLLTEMSAAEQTRLALSTAPPEVTSRASVYVLAGGRYTKTRTGTNGFSCFIEREFLEAIEPVCYDAEGSATLMRASFHREELRAQGLPETEVKRRIDAGFRERRFLAPRKPGIVYMMAAEQYSWQPVERRFWHSPPHYMLYAPYAKQEDMGGPPGPLTPAIGWPGQPYALMMIMAPSAPGAHDAHSK